MISGVGRDTLKAVTTPKSSEWNQDKPAALDSVNQAQFPAAPARLIFTSPANPAVSRSDRHA